MNLKTTDINRLIETLGIKALSGGNDGVYCRKNSGSNIS
jgi:hypothetical protein